MSIRVGRNGIGQRDGCSNGQRVVESLHDSERPEGHALSDNTQITNDGPAR